MVWARVPETDPPEAHLEWLSDEDRRRAQAFRFERDRRRHLHRSVLLRAVLARELGREPWTLRFGEGAHRKPRLDAAQAGELRFNLSHTQNMVVLALARGREVGVDVEAVDRRAEVERLARRVFSEREQAWLGGAPPSERRAVFFRGWTRKEAALKGLGTGFLREPTGLHVGLEPRPPAEPWTPDDAELGAWGMLVDLEAPDANLAAALAAEGPGWRVVVRPPAGP